MNKLRKLLDRDHRDDGNFLVGLAFVMPIVVIFWAAIGMAGNALLA